MRANISVDVATFTPLQKYRSTASLANPATRNMAIGPNGFMATDAAIQTEQLEFRPIGTQTVALVPDCYVAKLPPGGLSFARLVDEVCRRPYCTIQQIVHYLSTEQCDSPAGT